MLHAAESPCLGRRQPRFTCSRLHRNSSQPFQPIKQATRGRQQCKQSHVCKASNINIPAVHSTRVPYVRGESNAIWSQHTADAWSGYVGTWYMDIQDPAISTPMKASRAWKWRDETRAVLDQINLYDKERPGSNHRNIDDDFESQFFYDQKTMMANADEPFRLTTEDRGSHLLLLDLETYMRVPANLPPKPSTGGSTSSGKAGSSVQPEDASDILGSAQPKGVGFMAALQKAQEPASSVLSVKVEGQGGVPAREVTKGVASWQEKAVGKGPWGMELFLQDGSYRWGLILLYDSASGDLSKLTPVVEFQADLNPSTPRALQLSFDAHVKEERGRLDVDPSTWPVSTAGGTRQVLERGEDGILYRLPQQHHVAWEPPSQDRYQGANVITPLPDEMYVAIPPSLSLLEGQKDGLRVEWGGVLRSGDEQNFQRLILDFEAGSGLLKRVVKERF